MTRNLQDTLFNMYLVSKWGENPNFQIHPSDRFCLAAPQLQVKFENCIVLGLTVMSSPCPPSSKTGSTEFVTYICLATGNLPSHMRGSMVDLFTATLYTTLATRQDDLREAWRLHRPLREAVVIHMAGQWQPP